MLCIHLLKLPRLACFACLETYRPKHCLVYMMMAAVVMITMTKLIAMLMMTMMVMLV